MSLFRRKKSAPPPPAPAPAKPPTVLNAPEAGGGSGDVNVEALREVTGTWATIKDVIAGYGVAALLFVVSFIVAGWEWAVATTALMIPIIWIYTRKVHVEPGIRVLVVGKDPRSGSILFQSYSFPPLIFQQVRSEGLSNSIIYHNQLAYLAESIEWDDESPKLLPLRINFAWIHFNSLNFFLDHDIFLEVKEGFQLALEKSERLERYLEPMIELGVAEGVEERFNLLYHAARSPDAFEEDKANIRRRVGEINARLRQLSLDRNTSQDELKAVAEMGEA